MALNPLESIEIIEQRIGFNYEDKSILNSRRNWGRKIAPDMADKFYKCLDKNSETNAILNNTEGRIHGLHETFIQAFVRYGRKFDVVRTLPVFKNTN